MKKIKDPSEIQHIHKKRRIPFSIWLVGYFVGFRKELGRTQWLRGKDLGNLILKVLLILLVVSAILFGISFGIAEFMRTIGAV